METFRTDRYRKRAERLFTEGELQQAENEVTVRPEHWPVIRGTGGCRKARAGRRGSGKSGGVRIIYFYRSRHGAIYFMDIYPKSEQDDLSAADKVAMRNLVKTIQEHER
ncbi:MAG: type II toxin-antitoxin system RelE/ParE family toxin [Stellaceae bacterium]